jgi:hypothetical protein
MNKTEWGEKNLCGFMSRRNAAGKSECASSSYSALLNPEHQSGRETGSAQKPRLRIRTKFREQACKLL